MTQTAQATEILVEPVTHENLCNTRIIKEKIFKSYKYNGNHIFHPKLVLSAGWIFFGVTDANNKHQLIKKFKWMVDYNPSPATSHHAVFDTEFEARKYFKDALIKKQY